MEKTVFQPVNCIISLPLNTDHRFFCCLRTPGLWFNRHAAVVPGEDCLLLRRGLWFHRHAAAGIPVLHEVQEGRILSFANFNRSCFLPAVVNTTVALVLGGSPSMISTTPFPKRS
jgi:hypothetical protein